jgi:hypothetical protein
MEAQWPSSHPVTRHARQTARRFHVEGGPGLSISPACFFLLMPSVLSWALESKDGAPCPVLIPCGTWCSMAGCIGYLQQPSPTGSLTGTHWAASESPDA